VSHARFLLHLSPADFTIGTPRGCSAMNCEREDLHHPREQDTR
jgi:hypothetical protein